MLPPHWSRGNPIDILGDADPERYAQALAIAANDPNSDGLLVALTPQAMTDNRGGQAPGRVRRDPGKPVLASWMGGKDVVTGECRSQSGERRPAIRTRRRAFSRVRRYAYNLRGLYETPTRVEAERSGAGPRAGAQVDPGRAQIGRTLLTEFGSKQMLAAIASRPCLRASPPAKQQR